MPHAKKNTLTVATWNINSLRLRQGLLYALADALAPDVICLQETKVPDELFPHEVGPKLGYPHTVFAGMKGYNGVAIFSRLPIQGITNLPDWCSKADRRHIAATITEGPAAGIMIHNFYVPAGGDIPDPDQNPKYAHKLAFIAEARAYFAANKPNRSILVGDLNIAPLEHDVWSHKQLLNVVSHTPPETEGLNAWRAEGFTDAVRRFVPETEKLYTWWSYRNRDWRASDRGRRLDHIWVSDDLAPALKSYAVLKDARDWQQGSDHVPVALSLKV